MLRLFPYPRPITGATLTSPDRTDASPSTDARVAPVLVLFGAYYALQTLIRILLSSSADLDEAEQVLLTQHLAWGYGPQPPLYTWVQAGFFALFGTSIATLALFKNLLLFSTALLTYWTARLTTGRPAAGLAAASSLLFLPQFCWESQRDLTHSVLAAAAASAILLCWWQTVRTRHLAWYAALGLAAGLGLLSKYNVALWLAGLLVASLTLPTLRPALLHPRFLLTLALAGLLFLPNAAWILQHRDLAFATATKFEIQSRGWRTSLAGIKDLAQAAIAFAAPLALIYLLLFKISVFPHFSLSELRRSGFKSAVTSFGTSVLGFFKSLFSLCVALPLWVLRRSPISNFKSQTSNPALALLLRALLVILILLLGMIFLFHITNLKQRWFTPLLICLPVLAVIQLGPGLTPPRIQRIRKLAVLIMALVLVAIPGRILLAERLHRDERLSRPYRAAMQPLRTVLPPGALVLTETRHLGGNLRLALPGQVVADPALLPLLPHAPPPTALLWNATQSNAIPDSLLQAAIAAHPVPWTNCAAQYFTAPYPHATNHHLRLGLLLSP